MDRFRLAFHEILSEPNSSFPVVGLYSLWSWTLGRTRQLGAYIDNPGSRVPGEKRVRPTDSQF